MPLGFRKVFQDIAKNVSLHDPKMTDYMLGHKLIWFVVFLMENINMNILSTQSSIKTDYQVGLLLQRLSTIKPVSPQTVPKSTTLDIA